MSEFQYLNLNPENKKRNDCVTRAISLASGLPYNKIRKKLYHTAKLLDCEKLCPTCYSFAIQEVFGGVPVNCDGFTLKEFSYIHPQGTYLIRIQGHLTCIIDGKIFDTWDCDSKLCDLAWRMHK
jgi:hypothetical protein